MPKLSLVLLLICCTSHTYSQLIVNAVALKDGEDVSLRFPYISGPDTATSRKINHFLQYEILGNATIEGKAEALFRNARYISMDTIHQPGYTNLDYAVLNNSNVISLGFTGETMAAYPDDFASYYSFDTKTARLINAKDIFSQTGLKVVQQQLIQKREGLIAKFIRDNFADSEDSAYIREQYTNCKNETETAQICIRNNAVLFHIGRCFPHVARVYDTDLDITIPVQELSRYLSDYGKSILLNIEN